MPLPSRPLTLYGHAGPNPFKVTIILNELGIPYNTNNIAMTDVKNAEYTAINPNGRLPALYDPNTDITLWESGAIIEYLIEKYDPEHRLSFEKESTEAWHAKQWLFFQATGQGPYFGQAAWFSKYHPEHLPSAVDRYVKEINRVTGVLEAVLTKQNQQSVAASGGPWLVGGKLSYADLAFVSYHAIVKILFKEKGFDENEYPEVKRWMQNMGQREGVRKVLDVLEGMFKGMH